MYHLIKNINQVDIDHNQIIWDKKNTHKRHIKIIALVIIV